MEFCAGEVKAACEGVVLGGEGGRGGGGGGAAEKAAKFTEGGLEGLGDAAVDEEI